MPKFITQWHVSTVSFFSAATLAVDMPVYKTRATTATATVYHDDNGHLSSILDLESPLTAAVDETMIN